MSKPALKQVVPPKPRLDADFINPFLQGTLKTLQVQCQVSVNPGKPFIKTERGALADISAIIGIVSSSFTGSIALCFPKDTFLKIMEGMLGETYTEITADLEDGAGELLNIIFGSAKTELTNKGFSIEKAIPTIVRGTNMSVRHFTPTPTVVLPFEGSAGAFHIEIGLNN